MNVIIMGPAGSGKTTQARLLAEELGVPHLSAGELLHFQSQGESDLDRRIKKTMAAGKLLPDDVAGGLVAQHLKSKAYRQGFVLDGFPRNLNQAENFKIKVDKLVYLRVSREENTKRLLKRGRPDDTGEIIAKRLDIYYQETEPVLAYYKKRGVLVEVDGERSIEEIAGDILGKI